ncbi:MAG: hypothetical protein HYZ65_15315 [Burkholderiales bacterium]|nr:hypothetical protein [Burkholderiales bacterium]
MPPIRPCELPATALLRKYQGGQAYVDCYVAEVPLAVSHAEFVAAFYTTRLFKLERAILKWLAALPSSDAGAQALAAGGASTFAAWRVEGRDADQLLMADLLGRTRSWLMASPAGGNPAGRSTRLYFGSALVPKLDPSSGRLAMGFAFYALGGFHRLYSRLLLGAACQRLLASRCKSQAGQP